MNGSLLDVLGDAGDKPIAVFKVCVKVGLVQDGAWCCLNAWLLICCGKVID